ncbi:MAG: terminase [Firmicutes bacterium]|nr:terminase [Bacillota bacterium]
MTYKKTGQKILFFLVDDKTKIKSIKLPFGYVGIVWYKELDQFTGKEEIRSLNQSLMRGGSKFWCFSSFNPPKSRDNWVNTEQLIDEEDRLVDHSTYLDAPRHWLGDQFFLEAENSKNKSEKLYEHEYLSKVTGTGSSVFENAEDMQMNDEFIASINSGNLTVFIEEYNKLGGGLGLARIRYVSDIEDEVLAMYARDLNQRDIAVTIKEIYGLEISHKQSSCIYVLYVIFFLCYSYYRWF